MKKIITISLLIILINIPFVIAETENNIQNSSLPPTFSWRDINGIDYTTPVKDQRPCAHL